MEFFLFIVHFVGYLCIFNKLCATFSQQSHQRRGCTQFILMSTFFCVLKTVLRFGFEVFRQSETERVREREKEGEERSSTLRVREAVENVQ